MKSTIHNLKGGSAAFITGTDTDVGKTFATALLAAYFLEQGQSVCVFKPVQTGSPDSNRPNDPMWIEHFLGKPVPWHVSYCFAPPVAPTMADTEQIITIDTIIEDFKRLSDQYDVVLVEGAGGLRVPLTQSHDMRDLAKTLDTPVIIVSRPNLGTINHTLLTLEALKAQQLETLGVIVLGFNPNTLDPAELGLEAEFNRLMPDDFLGVINHYPNQTLQDSATSLLPDKLLSRLSVSAKT